MEEEKIYLNDEEGKPVAFLLLDVIEHENKKYIVVLPDEDEADEVMIFEVDTAADDFDSYSLVDDDELLARLFEIFKEDAADDFDFE